jgi:hypothetical protein
MAPQKPIVKPTEGRTTQSCLPANFRGDDGLRLLAGSVGAGLSAENDGHRGIG